MADHQDNEKWFEGKSSLFKSRAERVKADIARRKAGRKAIKGEDVKVEWEGQNGVWMGPLVSQELGFQNRIIEVDCHVLRGQGYSILDDERIDWKAGDTLYIGQGVWHQHHIPGDEPAMVFAIKPLPIQEYMGELNIVYKGDKPKVNPNYKAGTFLEEFAKIAKK
ncbi:MAG: cupin domain-containing protein [Deltaproteobacteria bacterium]|nr:MAG: cupin domain-containing protein [Deltaproteobacteria bacterium]